MTAIYGIKNCDTMKKAFAWLNERGVDYTFHDYKKAGVDRDVLEQAIENHGWQAVINKRGTTWRKLPPDAQEAMDARKALDIAQDNPSIIKRPLMLHNDQIYLGFKDAAYNDIFDL